MTTKIIKKDKHWEIHLYNSLGELTERIYVESIEITEKEECEWGRIFHCESFTTIRQTTCFSFSSFLILSLNRLRP